MSNRPIALIAAIALIALIQFSVPAGDAEGTLLIWARQANTISLWVGDFFVDRRAHTPAINGMMTPHAALCLLLQGTGLTFTVVPLVRALPGFLIVPQGWRNPSGRRADNYDQVCAQVAGVGPEFIRVPVAHWRT